MRKGRKIGLIMIGVTLLVALVLAWRLYPMGAVSEERARSVALALAPVEDAASPTTSTGNAADTYRKAIELIERLQADPADRARLNRYDEGSFDAEAADFFVRHGEILRLVHGGAGIAGCDWGETVMETRVPMLNGLRGLANFTLAHARFAEVHGEPGVMVEVMLATIALGRHVGAGMVVDKQSQIGIEIKSIHRLAAQLPRLSREQLQALPDRFARLPASATGKQVIEAELVFAKRAGRRQGGNIIVAGMGDGLEPLYQELAAVIDEQSPEQFARTVDSAVAKMKLNPFATITGPSFVSTRRLMAVLQAKQSMLRAAIDIQLNGEAARLNWPDPFGQGPFELAKSRAGFELVSQLTHRDSRVTLSVGGE